MGALDIIVIDYLQLMTLGKAERNDIAIGDITRNLKKMAKEFDCTIVLLSQLNRSVDNRPNKRPVMADLKESSAIEQDADVIFFLYRDEVYNPQSEQKGICEIITAKQRNGETGIDRVLFEGQYQRFSNHSRDYRDYSKEGIK